MSILCVVLAVLLRPFGLQPEVRHRTREVAPQNGYRCYESAGRYLVFVPRR